MDMGVVEDPTDTGLLLLRLGSAGQVSTSPGHRWFRRDSSVKSEPSVLNPTFLGPSLSLGFSDSAVLASSFVTKEANGGGSEETEKLSSRGSDDEEDGGGVGGRKKLRLTKEQSALLEDRFKEHNSLNPKQKLSLAKQLNLRPRQVEVWFQNRRARTKLKQTEVDCEFLRRCCETLNEENRRLNREIQELKALKLAAATPLYMQLPPATLMVCPSCERVVGEDDGGSKARAFSQEMKKKKTLFLKYS